MEINYQPIRILEVAEREAIRLENQGWQNVKLWSYSQCAYGITAIDPITECKVLFDKEIKPHYYWRVFDGI